MNIKDHLTKTGSKHSDMVDSYAYMMSSQYAKLQDDYFFIYIKKKPKYCPMFIYKWFIKKFVVIVNFK